MRTYARVDRRGGVLAGCLIALGIVVALAVVGVIVVALNWRGWTATGMESGLVKLVDEAELVESDRIAMKTEISQLMQDFRDKKVSFPQLMQVAEEVANSPIMVAGMVMFIEKTYLEKVPLTPEQKVEGSKELSRFVRGVAEGSISRTKIDDTTEPIHYAGGPGGDAIRINSNNISLELKQPEQVTTEEMLQFFANCKAEADAAGVPDEKYQVDMAGEFSEAIDRALGRAPAPEALPDPEAEPQPGDSGEG